MKLIALTCMDDANYVVSSLQRRCVMLFLWTWDEATSLVLEFQQRRWNKSDTQTIEFKDVITSKTVVAESLVERERENAVNFIQNAGILMDLNGSHLNSSSGKLQEEFLLQQKEIQRQHEQEQSRTFRGLFLNQMV